jgi:hypothetical protein
MCVGPYITGGAEEAGVQATNTSPKPVMPKIPAPPADLVTPVLPRIPVQK